jgi:hypothetical protein
VSAPSGFSEGSPKDDEDISKKKKIKKKRTRASGMDLDNVVDEKVRNNEDKIMPVMDSKDPANDFKYSPEVIINKQENVKQVKEESKDDSTINGNVITTKEEQFGIVQYHEQQEVFESFKQEENDNNKKNNNDNHKKNNENSEIKPDENE